ncbi:MAG TPA: Hsp33 family molecular chaperone HslO [Sphaerochaeta sp.]|nr:Hsp33 family molecular chaperone HslO [Sphaerochaeta sp.]
MIKQAISPEALQEHLTSLPADGREVFLIADGTLRLTAIAATTMINEMRANHDTGLLETYVLGQAYLASGLLASTVKDQDRVQLNVEGAGPIGGVFTEAWANGSVRGYLQNNPIPLTEELTSLDTDYLYGPGFLTVTKILEGRKTPFSGQVMLQHGDLAKDLAHYFSQSEQTPTLIILSIHFDEDGSVTGSGAVFIQALPGAEEATLGAVEDLSGALPSLGEALSTGVAVRAFIEEHYSQFAPKHLERQHLTFFCPCSKEQYQVYLEQLDREDKADLVTNGPYPLEIVCLNCSTPYHYSEAELKELLAPKKEIQ